MIDFQLKFNKKIVNLRPASQIWKIKDSGPESGIPGPDQEMLHFQLKFNKKMINFGSSGEIWKI